MDLCEKCGELIERRHFAVPVTLCMDCGGEVDDDDEYEAALIEAAGIFTEESDDAAEELEARMAEQYPWGC